MSEKKNKKKNPFSIYWIYAVIGVAIIGIQLFMSYYDIDALHNRKY